MSSFNAGYVFYHKMFKPLPTGKIDVRNLESRADDLLDYTLVNNDKLKFGDYIDSEKEYSFKLTTRYPGFASGLGQNHDIGSYDKNFKLGLLFDHTTGLPYLSGTSIKGKLKEPFNRVLYAGKSSSSYEYYSKDLVLEYFETLFKEIGLDVDLATEENINALRAEMFEGEVNGLSLPMYDRDVFLSAYIESADQKHNNRIFSDDYITPHESPIKNPNPLRFLRVRSGVSVAFRFDLHDSSVIKEMKKVKKEEMIKKLIVREKLGAKTSVGYGKFRE